MEEELQKSMVEQTHVRVQLEETNRKFEAGKDEFTLLQREVCNYKSSADNFMKDIMEKDALVETYKGKVDYMEDELSSLKLRLSTSRDDFERAQAEISKLKVTIKFSMYWKANVVIVTLLLLKQGKNTRGEN